MTLDRDIFNRYVGSSTIKTYSALNGALLRKYISDALGKASEVMMLMFFRERRNRTAWEGNCN